MNFFKRYTFFLCSFYLLYVTCSSNNNNNNNNNNNRNNNNNSNSNNNSNNNNNGNNVILNDIMKNMPGAGSLNNMEELLSYMKEHSNKKFDNHMELYNNLMNENNKIGKNDVYMQKLMDMLKQYNNLNKNNNVPSGNNPNDPTTNHANNFIYNLNEGNYMEKIEELLKNMNNQSKNNSNNSNSSNSSNSSNNNSNNNNNNNSNNNNSNNSAKAANPMEQLTNLFSHINDNAHHDEKGDSHPLEHIMNLLGHGHNDGDNKGGGNPLQQLASLLNHEHHDGDNKGGGNPLQQLASLLNHEHHDGDNKGGGNPLQQLASLLNHEHHDGDNKGGGNPLQQLASLFNHEHHDGDNKGGSNPLQQLASLFNHEHHDGDGKGENNAMEYLKKIFGNLQGNNPNGINGKNMGNLQSILNSLLNSEQYKKSPYTLDKTVSSGFGSRSKESMLLEYQHNKSEQDILRELQELINKNKIKNVSENNEKLKQYFSMLKGKYNPYSYERKILNDIINEDDIKTKYNIDDNFEKNLIVNVQNDNMEYDVEINNEEKEKKTEMFEDINELDDKDALSSGSLNSSLMRKNKTENEKLLRGLTTNINDDNDNLHECNCNNKLNNCVLSYINYNNLEYMLQSLDIDVKGLVRKHMLLNNNNNNDNNNNLIFEKNESFLLPLPPLTSKSNVQNTSNYILRVPRVLFLASRKSFSSSFDRSLFHIYNIMDTQLKWNTYLWGYGFKYYPIFFPKNLHTLLHNHEKQIGSEPFDLIFVHSSFVSNYYNYYFFLKNMPKITTLIFMNDGWDNNVKNIFLNLFPHIFFQNQVNIFEFNPLNNIDTVAEKKKLFHSLWNKVTSSTSSSSSSMHDHVIKNKHKKRKKMETKSNNEDDVVIPGDSSSSPPNNNNNSNINSNNINKYDEEDDEENKTLWAFLPHGVNHCCSSHYNKSFIMKGITDNNNNNNEEKEEGEMLETVVNPTFYYDRARNLENQHTAAYELSYSLLDLFLPECTFNEKYIFNNIKRDIDILYLYSTSNNYNDYLVQKIMDYIYNNNMNNLKDRIQKYEVDLNYWKLWGLQTTHKLIKNKMIDFINMLQRSKVCIISSKFAGMLNKMVIDALFHGCVVISDKTHNKDINKFIVTTKIPFEYYEISDLIYNKENMTSLANDLIDKINTTLEEVNSGKRNQMRIDAFKTILNTYTYSAVILNWIIPSIYFHYNKEKYEIKNNYFVLPQYFEKIISKSLKITSAKREKIIANIDLSLQEDLVMNNNEVVAWCIIWFLIFSIILFYMLKNSSLVTFLFRQHKLHR